MATDFYFEQMCRVQRHDETGEWDKFSTTKFSNQMYQKYKGLIPRLNTGNCNQLIYSEVPALMNHWPDVLKGNRTMDSFKKNKEIVLNSQSILIEYKNGKYVIAISMFSNNGKKQLNISDGRIVFNAHSKNNGIKAILNQCVNGNYKIGASALEFDSDKSKWIFSLTYKFEKEEHSNLNKNKILGVDLGVNKAYYCAVNFGEDRFFENGGDIDAFRKKVEVKRRNLQNQRVNCGHGSIGHGYKTRMRPVLNIKDDIAGYRKYKNNLMSRKIVDMAISLGCGTIQMEDLSGIASKNKLLKNWSYYDLQQMIINKATEVGIECRKIDPKFTSQRCSKCGFIHKDNRHGEHFKCLVCGYETHADYNAAKNISIKNIEQIISANTKQTEKSA